MLRRELGPTALIFLLFPPNRHLHLLLDAILHECAFLSDWGTVRPTESSSSRMGARCLLKLTTYGQRFVGIAPVCNQFARTGVTPHIPVSGSLAQRTRRGRIHLRLVLRRRCP